MGARRARLQGKAPARLSYIRTIRGGSDQEFESWRGSRWGYTLDCFAESAGRYLLRLPDADTV